MPKKQFEHVVSNITRPRDRVKSMSELLNDEQVQIDDSIKLTYKPIEETQSEKLLTKEPIYSHTQSGPLQHIENVKLKTVMTTSQIVRDGFSMPDSDYSLIETLIKKAGFKGSIINKSEILRAGLQTLNNLSDQHFLDAINGVIQLKPGRKLNK